MISLDQILLLQEKVETAVAKITSLTAEVAQLKSENDALRTKCSELSNSLSEKTEFVSTLQSDQNQIEMGIINALNRLDSLENEIYNRSSASPEAENNVEQSASEDSTEEVVVSNIEVSSSFEATTTSEPIVTNDINNVTEEKKPAIDTFNAAFNAGSIIEKSFESESKTEVTSEDFSKQNPEEQIDIF